MKANKEASISYGNNTWCQICGCCSVGCDYLGINYYFHIYSQFRYLATCTIKDNHCRHDNDSILLVIPVINICHVQLIKSNLCKHVLRIKIPLGTVMV